ncbi:response regulator [Desulfobacula phenolica]|uniref:Response regulator receiver domain-containing protein n=1 Tax=Desulfobacula phenolica TaxID=90732 RepID=A0A1H2GD55_9BACT|nr:response regulator [Desulfobacula phenolica]SDU17593.1 Response regulator receiver domain-containing protein [Desulfobacula phenolica]
MTQTGSFLKDKHILAVDDEWDVIETIQEILDEAKVDIAQDYETASAKILQTQYDLAILDIMGVNGIKLLEECVKRDIPAVMLTANSLNPESLMQSIKKGAISYLSKEHLSELDSLLNELLGEKNQGKPVWKLLFEKLGNHFNQRFGKGWKDDNKDFWNDFEKNWEVSRGIQERLLHDKNIIDKGI